MPLGHNGALGRVVHLVALALWRGLGLAQSQKWMDRIALEFQLRVLFVLFLRAQVKIQWSETSL